MLEFARLVGHFCQTFKLSMHACRGYAFRWEAMEGGDKQGASLIRSLQGAASIVALAFIELPQFNFNGG